MTEIRARRAAKQAKGSKAKTAAGKTSSRDKDKTGAIEDDPAPALDERGTESAVNTSGDPFSDPLKERRATQGAPAKATRVDRHVSNSRSQPKPTKASAAVRGTTRDQHESKDQDTRITLDDHGDDTDGIDLDVLKERRVAQRPPAKATRVDRHVSDSRPQPKSTKASAAIRGSTGEKTRATRDQPRDQYESKDQDTRITLDDHGDDTDGIDLDILKERRVVQRPPAKATRVDRHVSDSRPQPKPTTRKASTAVRGTVSEKATTRDQHESEEQDSCVTLADEDADEMDYSIKHDHIDYGDDTVGYKSDAHSPLSELTDDSDDDARMTSQVTIPTKRVQSNVTNEKSNDSVAAPPQKKAKKASTAPTKRNPARKNRANGF